MHTNGNKFSNNINNGAYDRKHGNNKSINTNSSILKVCSNCVINLDSDEDGEDDDIVFLGRMTENDQKATNANRTYDIRDEKVVKQKDGAFSSAPSSNVQRSKEAKYISNGHTSSTDSSIGPCKSSHVSDTNNNKDDNTSSRYSNLGFKRTYLESQNDNYNVQCEICNLLVSLNALDYHMNRHEKSGDILKYSQDKEYRESVQEDILKNTLKDENERMEEKKRKNIEDETELSEIMKASKEVYERQEMEKFKNDLLPEPLLGPSIRIRFYSHIFMHIFACEFMISCIYTCMVTYLCAIRYLLI